jgi:hypothetical protein
VLTPLLVFGAVVAAGFSVAAVNGIHAQTRGAALSGIVSSAEEGPMEGVLVSAKRTGSNITVTVVSNAQGRYTLPAAKLGAGTYKLSIRAVGYDLDSNNSVDISAQGGASADIHLKKTADLAGQLSNAEWLASMPGTDAQKKSLLDCVSCHEIAKIVNTRYTADDFMTVIPRMATYAPGTTPLQPQRRLNTPRPRDPAQLRARAGRVSRQRQPEHGLAMEVSAEDAAAPQGRLGQRRDHRIRSAAPGDRTARRRRRCARHGVVFRFRHPGAGRGESAHG